MKLNVFSFQFKDYLVVIYSISMTGSWVISLFDNFANLLKTWWMVTGFPGKSSILFTCIHAFLLSWWMTVHLFRPCTRKSSWQGTPIGLYITRYIGDNDRPALDGLGSNLTQGLIVLSMSWEALRLPSRTTQVGWRFVSFSSSTSSVTHGRVWRFFSNS